MFSSIRTKLTLWYVGILSLSILIFAAGTYFALMHSADRDLDQRLIEMGRSFAAGVAAEQEDTRDDASPVDPLAEAASEMRFRDYQFIVYAPDGKVRASTAEIALAYHNGPAFQDIEVAGNGWRLYRTELPVGGANFHLVVLHSLRERELLRRKLLTIFLAGIPITLLFAGIGGYYLARKSLAPAVQLGREAGRISALDLTERLTVKNRQDELGQLAMELNRLLERLEAAFEQQRRFMADASHELRTPLAIIRGESDVALSAAERPSADYRESLSVIRNESQRLSRIVGDLLTLARADAGRFSAQLQPLYLDEIVADAARSVEVLARQRNISIAVTADGEAPMQGDELLLRQMFLNLLDNAIKYGREGGSVEVQVSAEPKRYVVTVADDGPGIPATHQAHIFDRFYRADAARERSDDGANAGAGLGLSIARLIAETHAGQLELTSSNQNATFFSVTFPR